MAPRKDATRPADDAAAAAEGSGSGSRPTLGRLSTSSSAPDLQKLAAEGGAETDGADGGGGASPQPDIQRLSAGAAASGSSLRRGAGSNLASAQWYAGQCDVLCRQVTAI